MVMNDWNREPRERGPAGWDWQEAIGILLLTAGLIGVGFVNGIIYQLSLGAVPS
jgi:hypothetical protein